MQCTYSVTLTDVHKTTVVVGKQYTLHISVCVRVCGCKGTGACSLTYPACNAHEPYCLRPLWLHHIFPHYLINGTIFETKLLNIKFVFRFSLRLLSKTFLILRIQPDIVINVKTSSRKVAVILVGV